MEESRLLPMPLNYDVQKFNTLFAKTEGLRRKLASGIDSRRFGVDYDEILSWFSNKFLFAFTKYHTMDEQILLGHLIKSLQFFKCRILRSAYTQKFSQTILPFDEVDETQMVDIEIPPNHYYDKLISFIRPYISDNALILLEIQLHPTPFILRRLREEGIDSLHKIPDEILIEYFDLGFNNRSIKYITCLKKEIKVATQYAKEHFSKN